MSSVSDAVLVGMGALAAAVWLAALAATVRAVVVLPRMHALPIPAREWPRLSVVRPACNEAERLAAATRTTLAMDYPDLQVVLVDDRSTDDTPAIVEALAADLGVVAVHVDALPAGWLGKLNALQRGVERADGDWLLFADADAHFAPGTAQRAIAYADAQALDFVSVLPGVERADFLADATFSSANALLALGTRPWKIERDEHTIAATGAFMLVRRTAFERTPGFEWLRLEVADDFGLCLLIKRHGGRAGFLVAPNCVRLTWYASFAELTEAMQKNFFAIAGRFSPARCVVQVVALIALALGPFLPLFALSSPWALPVALAALGASAANGLLTAWWTDRPLLSAALPSIGLLATAFVVARAAIVGVRQGGIIWRGVLYRTEDLRDVQHVRL